MTEQEVLKAVVTEQEILKAVVTEQEVLKAVVTEQEVLKAVVTEQEVLKAVVTEQEVLKAGSCWLEQVRRRPPHLYPLPLNRTSTTVVAILRRRSTRDRAREPAALMCRMSDPGLVIDSWETRSAGQQHLHPGGHPGRGIRHSQGLNSRRETGRNLQKSRGGTFRRRVL